MIKIGQLKRVIIHRKLMETAVDKSRRKVLDKFGAFVRRTARSSIRKAKKVSRPGEPPKGKVGTLRQFIEFASDGRSGNVLIGPAKTNQVFFQGDGQPVSGTVPSVLEKGGTIKVLEVFKWGRWQRADLRSKRRNAGLKTRLRTVKIAARPYMGPALAKELPKLPALWANSVRK